jgi:hypothetical protein
LRSGHSVNADEVLRKRRGQGAGEVFYGIQVTAALYVLMNLFWSILKEHTQKYADFDGSEIRI